MSKTIEYFYIFSKLTTSLVLIIIIFFMGYALIRSYDNTKNDFSGIENKLNNFSLEFLENKSDFKVINNEIARIKEILENSKSFEINEKYITSVEMMMASNKLLEEKIKKLEAKISKKQYSDQKNVSGEDSILEKQLLSTINLIILKFKDGENFDKEFIYLETIAPKNKYKNLEKLDILNLKKFYGLDSLFNEFEISTKKYIDSKFLNSNKNPILSFVYKFLIIKPSNLNIYEDEDLNILMNAKKYIEKDNFVGALSLIKKLDPNQEFFKKCIEQINIYIDFVSQIRKVSKVA